MKSGDWLVVAVAVKLTCEDTVHMSVLEDWWLVTVDFFFFKQNSFPTMYRFTRTLSLLYIFRFSGLEDVSQATSLPLKLRVFCQVRNYIHPSVNINSEKLSVLGHLKQDYFVK